MRSLIALFALAIPASAPAHVSIASGPAQANKSQIITLGVGHGCTDSANKKLDTVKIRVAIPAGVTGVRGLRSDFGPPKLIKSGSTVTHVEWEKPASDLLDGDDAYYELKLRAKVPDMPFTKLQWNVEQTCEDSTTHVRPAPTLWEQPEGSTTGEPAPIMTVVPTRVSSIGWNKFTMGRAMTIEEVALYFGDAQIVWKGTAAYSSNAATAMLIAATPGVTALDSVSANDEVWVKY